MAFNDVGLWLYMTSTIIFEDIVGPKERFRAPVLERRTAKDSLIVGILIFYLLPVFIFTDLPPTLEYLFLKALCGQRASKSLTGSVGMVWLANGLERP